METPGLQGPNRHRARNQRAHRPVRGGNQSTGVPPARFDVTYDYDEDPGITFPTAFGFTTDLKYFPRDEDHIPGWLREKLREEAEGRAME
ncbi:hypothetical protein HNR06_002884 [Nocardiopsis arvandica]|uniref:Uncharacterized protein n=1 Tax=Nocardiopsis sinuspersici TaxID=501010 RepID=A0A7Z0BKL2_9ACTN|nr:hypothetical protein [Nocardiopsis sinuspersici]